MPTVEPFALIRPAEVLHRRLLAEGFAEGPPPDLAAADATADAAVCRAMECPACTAVGLAWWPYHRELVYRVIAACECGYGEEV